MQRERFKIEEVSIFLCHRVMFGAERKILDSLLLVKDSACFTLSSLVEFMKISVGPELTVAKLLVL